MTAWVVLIAAGVAIVGGDGRPPFVRRGGDGSQGILVNHSPGAQPGDPAVAGRPTVVFVHGFNPLPRTVHFTMGEQVAAAVARRTGGAFNIFSWNWNGATFVSLDPRVNNSSAVAQGRSLAAALRRTGVAPARVHLIGHSSGSIVAASAAQTLATEHGQPVAQLTLLEPASFYHGLVFERLAATSSARRVENYWSPDPSAYGRAVTTPGVHNTRVNGPRPILGVISPRRSSHLYVVEWYITTIEDPNRATGFNRSLLLAAIGGRV
jgi:pimeloyl-ACP methyl ester carboxylesterase